MLRGAFIFLVTFTPCFQVPIDVSVAHFTEEQVSNHTDIIDLGGFDDGTPLAFAAWKQDIELATGLLKHGANPNLQGTAAPPSIV